MLSWVRAIFQRRFVRNVIVVAMGTAGAQAIGMAFAPIITRIYGPEAFGLAGSFAAILSIVTPAAALTYPIAIVLPKSDHDALGLAKLSAVIAILLAVICALVFLGFGDSIAGFLGLKDIAHLLLLIPLAMLFSAYMQIMQQWLIRKKQFKITARAAVIQALALNSAKAGTGWFYPAGAVLILLTTFGHALHGLILWAGIRRAESAKPDTAPVDSPAKIFDLAKNHRDFPLFRAPQVIINAFSQSLPILLLASFFGPSAAGFYTLGRTVMGIPSSLIGKSVGDVLYPRITEAIHNKENIHRLLSKATWLLAGVGLLPFALVVIFGPWLFMFVFGDEWVIAGEYARWLAVWLYFSFLKRPSVVALVTLGLQDFFLVYEIASVAPRVAALYVGFSVFNDDVLAVIYFSLTGMVLDIFLVWYILGKSRGTAV